MPITFMPLYSSWPYFIRLVTVAAYRVHSQVRLMITFLFQYYTELLLYPSVPSHVPCCTLSCSPLYPAMYPPFSLANSWLLFLYYLVLLIFSLNVYLNDQVLTYFPGFIIHFIVTCFPFPCLPPSCIHFISSSCLASFCL